MVTAVRTTINSHGFLVHTWIHVGSKLEKLITDQPLPLAFSRHSRQLSRVPSYPRFSRHASVDSVALTSGCDARLTRAEVGESIGFTYDTAVVWNGEQDGRGGIAGWMLVNIKIARAWRYDHPVQRATVIAGSEIEL